MSFELAVGDALAAKFWDKNGGDLSRNYHMKK
jgi:hypothetical protein